MQNAILVTFLGGIACSTIGVFVVLLHMPFIGVAMSHAAFAGALLGLWCLDRDSGEQFVVVQHMLPAHHTRQGSVYLTFTQDTLVQFHDELETNHKGKRIVGWYHTHPRMGIFLSHYDTWLHNNFFPEPWQVALVVEPHTSLAGFFIRRDDGALDPTRYFGFHELNGNLGRSMVEWKNLQSNDEESEGV